MESFDVIIAGAGISGLILAKDLSENFSVLVVEKEPIDKPNSKYWLTTHECLDCNPNLKECIDVKYNKMDFISHDEKKFEVFGDYILWDSSKLCDYFKKGIAANGAEIRYSNRFYSYSLSKNNIVAYVNDRKIEAKLLIDCMGANSPLVQLNNSIEIYGYFLAYGGVLPLKQKFDPIVMANTIVGRNPNYIEAFPKSDNTANFVVIKPVSQLQSLDILKKDFNFITKETKYSNYFSDFSEYKELGGIVAIGKANVTALDRILFFGEAGQIQPAVTNTCVTKLLLYHKKYADFISEQLNANKLRQKDLLNHPRTMNKFSQRFQFEMYCEFQKWSSIEFSEFIDLLNCMDSKSMNDFMFNEINLSYFLNWNRLRRVIKARNFIWFRPLLKSALSY